MPALQESIKARILEETGKGNIIEEAFPISQAESLNSFASKHNLTYIADPAKQTVLIYRT